VSTFDVGSTAIFTLLCSIGLARVFATANVRVSATPLASFSPVMIAVA